jgi:hypothetical protein
MAMFDRTQYGGGLAMREFGFEGDMAFSVDVIRRVCDSKRIVRRQRRIDLDKIAMTRARGPVTMLAR